MKALAAIAALALAGPAAAQDAAAPAMSAQAMAAMPGMDMSHAESPLGSYPASRDASGTSWQPDASTEDGVMVHSGPWMVMTHGLLNGVYDNQSGPRGGEKSFVSGMLMVMASRPLDEGDTLQLRAMLAPDPVMGPSGYPLLLATGETADGKTALIDRQHPHDLFMELSASVSRVFGVHDSAFLYAGVPGEPALGPPAFMHRMSTMDSPEAPISHHWLDSTHITYGVITAGWVHDNFKLEVSSFKGREPDQRRYDIETPKLDSESVRLSWNPDARWSLQTSWGHLTSPEQLEPLVNEDRWTASAIYTRPVGGAGWWSTTAAFGSKRLSNNEDRALNAWLLESALKPTDPWTLFVRAETVDNPELLTLPGGLMPVETVSKLSLGAIHDWRVARHLKAGLGALYDFDFVPSALRSAYGNDPHGAMAFMRLKLD